VTASVRALSSARARARRSALSVKLAVLGAAVTAAVVLFAGLTVRHYELTARRMALARNVAMVAGSQPLPSVDALKNFDAIRRMSQPTRADDELLALASEMK